MAAALTFNKAEWGNISLLTYLYYNLWKETMTFNLEAMNQYENITGEKPESPLIDLDYCKSRARAAKAMTIIYL
jgi:hypothetical protein